VSLTLDEITGSVNAIGEWFAGAARLLHGVSVHMVLWIIPPITTVLAFTMIINMWAVITRGAVRGRWYKALFYLIYLLFAFGIAVWQVYVFLGAVGLRGRDPGDPTVGMHWSVPVLIFVFFILLMAAMLALFIKKSWARIKVWAHVVILAVLTAIGWWAYGWRPPGGPFLGTFFSLMVTFAICFLWLAINGKVPVVQDKGPGSA
jgi:hypothetical protein